MTLLLLSILAAAPPSTVVEDIDDPAFLVGRELRCPVCQGRPIADSPSEMAQAMMTRVREMLAEGRSRQEILDYFVASYGEWVLLKPEAKGTNWLVWLLPPTGLLLGVLLVRRYMKSTRDKEADEVEPPAADEYLRRVREEVER